MKRALFASDYDGTLCRGGRIDEDTIAAAARFRAQGGLFGVCSGRDPGTLKAELAQFGLVCDFLIMMNGARIEADGSCLREITLQGYDCVLPLLRERTQFSPSSGMGWHICLNVTRSPRYRRAISALCRRSAARIA